MKDTWGTAHNGQGHRCQEKMHKNKKKTSKMKGNESAKGYWSRDVGDQVIVYVLKYVSFYFISCIVVKRGLFELGCLGPSVSITVLCSYTGNVS